MAESRFDWVESAHRYRDKQTGRFVSPTTIGELRDVVQSAQREAMADLARRLSEREITVAAFETGMRERIMVAQGVSFMFGRGGRQAMTADDRQALGELVAEQYGYLRGFAEDAAAGRMTAGQIRARSDLYGASAGGAYWRGRAASFDGLNLPGYPRDGQTPCRSRCQCSWSIDETEDEYEATWKLSSAEHCPGCVSRASRWSPYRQPKQQRMLRVVEAA